MRSLRIACATAGALLAAAVPAGAATLETIETPSANVDPATVRFNGDDHPRRLRANVLLPDGYDPGKAHRVLFLLHGAGDSYASWARPERGDILETAKGLDAIVVMPEAATGFYSNWWNDGRRADPGWERFYLDELIPLVERRYRILPGRGNHAIAGLSMGGFGATYLASQVPGYFGSAAAFSGFVQPQRETARAGFSAVTGSSYEQIFGPIDGFYATGHNPTMLTRNLRATRLFVAVGDGTAEPGAGSTPQSAAAGGVVEAELRQQADMFVAAARDAGVDTTYSPEHGVHDWPYWRRHLREAIAWGLFEPVPEAPSAWSYTTTAPSGNAWGLAYATAKPPTEALTLSRDGARLRGDGSGRVTVTNAAGCSFTADLPFDRALPPRTCGRLTVRIAPARVSSRRVARIRVRVLRSVGKRRFSVPRARVRIGHVTRRTDASGRAVLRFRPRGGPGVRRMRVSAPGLGPVVKRVRVR